LLALKHHKKILGNYQNNLTEHNKKQLMSQIEV